MRLFTEAKVPLLVALLREAAIKVVDIGGRGKAFPPLLPLVVWAHCLYFRDPDTLIASRGDRVTRRLAALLGFALVFEHHDFACDITEVMARAAMLFAEGAETDRQGGSLGVQPADGSGVAVG